MRMCFNANKAKSQILYLLQSQLYHKNYEKVDYNGRGKRVKSLSNNKKLVFQFSSCIFINMTFIFI